MIGMHFKIEFEPHDKILKKRGLGEGGRVQKYIDSEVLRLNKPYTPHDTGELSNSGDSATEVGSGEVSHNTPCARYQYYGKVMVGPPPKTVTDKDLKYQGGGARGAKWFERMKAAHKEDILQGAADIAGGRAG